MNAINPLSGSGAKQTELELGKKDFLPDEPKLKSTEFLHQLSRFHCYCGTFRSVFPFMLLAAIPVSGDDTTLRQHPQNSGPERLQGISSSCLRVLHFVPRVPWPLNTGAKLRNYHLARQLARSAQISLLAFSDNGIETCHDSTQLSISE